MCTPEELAEALDALSEITHEDALKAMNAIMASGFMGRALGLIQRSEGLPGEIKEELTESFAAIGRRLGREQKELLKDMGELVHLIRAAVLGMGLGYKLHEIHMKAKAPVDPRRRKRRR